MPWEQLELFPEIVAREDRIKAVMLRLLDMNPTCPGWETLVREMVGRWAREGMLQ